MQYSCATKVLFRVFRSYFRRMQRNRIQFTKPFQFEMQIPVRISDINYGGHVGNDSILSILHECRLNWLKQWNYTEMNAAGVGLIMADSAIQYRAEAFHGDISRAQLYVDEIGPVMFNIFYKLSAMRDAQPIDIVYARTCMVCFDYQQRTKTEIPVQLLEKLTK